MRSLGRAGVGEKGGGIEQSVLGCYTSGGTAPLGFGPVLVRFSGFRGRWSPASSNITVTTSILETLGILVDIFTYEYCELA